MPTEKVIFVRSALNYDRDAVSLATGLKCEDKSLTKQSFLEETDINTIVRRFNLTGQLPEDVRRPVYGDYEGVFDFHSAMNAIVQAEESFEAMPADVRARFHNSPAEFVDFVAREENREEAIRLGLVDKPLAPAPAPQAKPVPVNPTPGGSPGEPAPAAPVAPQ